MVLHQQLDTPFAVFSEMNDSKINENEIYENEMVVDILNYENKINENEIGFVYGCSTIVES